MPPDPTDLTALTPGELLAEYASGVLAEHGHFRRLGRPWRDPRLAAAEAELLRRLALVPPDAPAPEEPPRG